VTHTDDVFLGHIYQTMALGDGNLSKPIQGIIGTISMGLAW